MYIDKIDSFINKQFEQFYDTNIYSSKKIISTLERDFRGEGKIIQNMIESHISKLDKKSVEKLLDKNIISILREIIKKYLYFYILGFIAYDFSGTHETFVSQYMNLTRTIDFKNKENQNVSNMYDLIKKINILLKINPDKLQDKLDNYQNPILSHMFTVLDLKLFRGSQLNSIHNIVVYLIFVEIYVKQEKKEFMKLIDEQVMEKGEYMDIYIVVQSLQKIDYLMLESMFQDAVNTDLEIYQSLLESNAKDSSIYNLTNALHIPGEKRTIEDKIRILFENKILTPISHDFLRIHKDDEELPVISKRNEEQSKLRKIIDNIEMVSEYYSPKLTEKKKQTIIRLLKNPFEDKFGVIMNDFEERKIIHKMQMLGNKTIQDSEYYADFILYRQYPFIDFKHYIKSGFSIHLNKRLDVIRYVNIMNQKRNAKRPSISKIIKKTKSVPEKKKEFIHTKFSNERTLQVSGISVNFNKSVERLEKHKLIPITGKVNGIVKEIKRMIKYNRKKNCHHSKDNCAYYYVFDQKNDPKSMLDAVYIRTEHLIVDSIMRLYRDINQPNLYSIHRCIEYIQKRYFTINPSLVQNILRNTIFASEFQLEEIAYDEKEDQIIKNLKNVVEIKSTTPLTIKNLIKPKTKVNTICQHNYDLRKIRSAKVGGDYYQMVYEYYNKYIDLSSTGTVCSSCGEMIAIKEINIETQNLAIYNNQVTLSLKNPKSLQNLPQYLIYEGSIPYIDGIIERLCAKSHFTDFYGVGNFGSQVRRNVVRNVIDLIEFQNKTYRVNPDKRKKESVKNFGIVEYLSRLFFFKLEEEIFVFKSNQIDKFKILKYNNIVCYIIFCLLLDLSESQILNINMNDKRNYILFLKFGIRLFQNMKIRINDNNEIDNITEYPLLCFIIFYIASVSVDYKIFKILETNTRNIQNETFQHYVDANIKVMVNTIVDIINSVLIANNGETKSYFYDATIKRFYTKLYELYSGDTITTKLREKNKKFIKIIDKKIRIVKKNVIPYTQLKGKYQSYYVFKPTFFYKNNRSSQIPSKQLYRSFEKIDHRLVHNHVFRNWVYTNSTLYDLTTGETYETIKNVFDSKQNNQIEKYKHHLKRRIANNYCLKGGMHSIDVKTLECSKCKKKVKMRNFSKYHKELNSRINRKSNYMPYLQYNETLLGQYNIEHSLTDEEVLKVFNIWHNSKIVERDDKIKSQKQVELNYKKQHTRVKDAEDKFLLLKDKIREKNLSVSSPNKFEFKPQYLEHFVNKLYKVIGEKLVINDENHYLMNDTIVVNGNVYGLNIKKSEFTTGNHVLTYDSFFNKHVKIVTHSKYDFYYDMIHKYYLGFKERNQKIKKHTEQTFIPSVRYSLLTKLKYLGFENDYILLPEIDSDSKKDEMNVKTHIFNQLIIRMQNLQNIMKKFKAVLSMINFKKKNSNPIVQKYKTKFDYIKLTNDNKHIFKNWKHLIHSRLLKSKSSFTFIEKEGQRYIPVDSLIKITEMDSVVLYIFLKDIDELFKENNKSSHKQYLLMSIFIEFINMEFHNYFSALHSREVKSFKIQLDENFDVETGEHSNTENISFNDIDPTYDEEAEMEKREDERERDEALDLDGIDITGNNYADDNDEYQKDDDYI